MATKLNIKCTSEKPLFSKLKKGDYFMYDNELFIKTSEVSTQANSICLNDGMVGNMHDGDDISPISELNISYKI